MSRNRIPLAAFFGSAALCAGQTLYYAPLLPEKLASHFGPSGLPNGWMDRGPFVGLALGVVLFLTATLFSASRRFRSLDAAKIRLPNKEYWMAPERRGETIDFLCGWLLGFGAATLLLMLDVFHQVFRYNLFLTKRLDHPVASLLVYVLFTGAWLAAFFRKFSGKRPATPL